MQKKSGYLSTRAQTRQDRIKIYADTEFHIEPHIHEGATFLGVGIGTTQVWLPEAKAGRKFTFITSPDGAGGGIHYIDINPFGGIFSSDRIYDPANAGFVDPGFSIINAAGQANQRITLECHNDGFWSVTHFSGIWEVGDRSFEVVVTRGLHLTNDGYIGMLGDPRLQVDLYVKNDKFVVSGATTIVDQVTADNNDLNNMSMENFAGDAGEVDIMNDSENHVRFYMGGADEFIGLDDGVDLQLSDGYADITILAAGMESAVAVIAGGIRVPVYGIEGDISGADGAALQAGSFTVEVHNDEWRDDIATESVWAGLITLTDDYSVADPHITGIVRTSDTVITISVAGNITHDTGTGGLLIHPNAFTGVLRASGIAQKLEGTVTP